jgi:SAM-dependent methyltransferase
MRSDSHPGMNPADQRAIARQLRCPTGADGLAVGERMIALNALMNQMALEQLDPRPSDQVLEIGFGPGALLDQILTRTSSVAGVDFSLTMVQETSRRLGARVKICLGSALALPFEGESFSKICTVNTVYFWDDLHQAFAQCMRVLQPGGSLVVCFNASDELAKGSWDQYGFNLHREEDIMDAVRAAGFSRIDCTRTHDPEQEDFFCLRAS